jgi:hypothetical protein
VTVFLSKGEWQNVFNRVRLSLFAANRSQSAQALRKAEETSLFVARRTADPVSVDDVMNEVAQVSYELGRGQAPQVSDERSPR